MRVLSMALGCAALSPGCQLRAVDIYPGSSIQSAVNANPAGTVYVLKSGVHRLQSITPKDRDIYRGEPGTVLSGAVLLTSFNRQGSFWVAGGQTQQGNSGTSIPCQAGWQGCQYPEQLFFDDTLLQHVDSASALGAGKWYFDYSADTIYLADDPTGHKVETSVTTFAFRAGGSNVTISGMTIEKFATPAQEGAISLGTGWIVQQNEIRFNHGSAIRCGNSMQILGNNIHHNGQMGMACSGTNVTVDGNEIAYNNAAHFDYGGANGEGGATKFSQTTGLTVSSNYVHDNDGPGIWMDGSNYGWTVQGNRTARNKSAGILDEISYDGVIRYNVVENDGGLTNPSQSSLWYRAGIMVASSPNAEIYGNNVVDCGNGIGAVSVDRGTGPRGQYVVKNLYVHDNTVTQTSGAPAGMVTQATAYDFGAYTSWNNRFVHNTYKLPPSGTAFTWYAGGSNYVDMTSSQWMSAGQDATGIWMPATASLTATTYATGDRVRLSAASAVRSLPTYSAAGTIVSNLVAGVLGSVTKARGPIFSDGDTWWQVAWDSGSSGWVPAASLSASTANADSISPTVGISSPFNNAVVSGSVAVSAVAGDNVAVTKVEFKIDGVVMATNTAAPWGFTWTIGGNSAQSGAGSHTLTATAYDAAGNTGGALITVTIAAALDTTPPSVSFGAPANGSQVSGVVPITATAADNVGVTKVEFSIDGVWAANTVPPWAFNWDTTNVTVGSHTITAKALDAAGNASTASIAVTVSDIKAPSIAITSPLNGSTVTGIVAVKNTVSDNVGVVKVELYVDGTLTGAATAAPWTLNWDTAKGTSGSHTLSTKAFDAAGNSKSASVTVTVTVPATTGPDTTAPSIGISFPYNNSRVWGVVEVTNVVSDNVGVVRVELYVDDMLVTSTVSAPWNLSWPTWWVSRGPHVLLIKAFDAAGNAGGAVITVTK